MLLAHKDMMRLDLYNYSDPEYCMSDHDLDSPRSFLHDLRARAKDYRERNNLDQKGMAERLCVHQTAISKFENGKLKRIPIDLLDRLVNLLNSPGARYANRLRQVADLIDSESSEDAQRKMLEDTINGILGGIHESSRR